MLYCSLYLSWNTTLVPETPLLLVPVSSSASSEIYYQFVIVFFFLSLLKYNHVNVQNYLKCHTSDVRNRKLQALFYSMSTMFKNFALPFLKLPSFVCPTKISHRMFHVYLKLHRCSLPTIVLVTVVISRAVRIFNGRSGLIKDMRVGTNSGNYLFTTDTK